MTVGATTSRCAPQFEKFAFCSHVVVSAQQNGTIVASTVPNPTTGEFFLSHLPVGNYDVVITADNSAADVIGAVPVAASGSTILSTSVAPLTLVAASTGSIAGTVTLPAGATEAAYVAAKQSIATGPTVTLRYTSADLSTGAYTIGNLPLAAPQYAVYSSTLPLKLAANTNVLPGVGKFRVEASGTGYATKAVDPVNIALANATSFVFFVSARSTICGVISPMRPVSRRTGFTPRRSSASQG